LLVGGWGNRAPEVRALASGVANPVSFGGLGASPITTGPYEGVVYDEANDAFLVFKNTNPISVYRVRASDFYVDQPAVSGTLPAQRPNGIHNAVQYVPELRGVVLANSYTGNVLFLRTAQ
jgi:hypothetical protein